MYIHTVQNSCISWAFNHTHDFHFPLTTNVCILQLWEHQMEYSCRGFFIYPPPLPSHLHIPLPRIDISAWWQQWGSTSDSFFRIIKTGQMHATRFSTLCTCTANGLPPSMQKWLQQVLLGTCACKSTLHIVHYIEHGPLLELTLTCTCSCRSALILVNMHMYTCTNACNKLSIY